MTIETIECGDLCEDKVTNFRGVVMAIVDYLHNEDRIQLKSRELNNGVPLEAQWFDKSMVSLLGKAIVTPVHCSSPKYKLGSKAKDSLSDYRGVITGIAYHIAGCIRYVLQSPNLKKDMLHPVDDLYIPESQIELLKEPKSVSYVTTGGPMKAPTMKKDPSF